MYSLIVLPMNKRQKTWLLVSILGPIVVCAVLLIPELVWRIGGYAGRSGADRVLHGDHAELLSACRQMISHYGSYTSDFDNPTSPKSGEKGLQFWSVEDGYTYETDPRLPKAIRKIEPMWACVGTNYIYIHLKPPSRSVIIADGGGASAMISNRFGPLTLLTNGLWFCR
jgi:hypothetical protein